MAVPIQLGAPWVPVAWAAEAVALTWVAKRYAHPYAGGAAVLIGALALAHLLLLEYPVNLMTAGFDRTWPFIGPEGLTFAFVAAAALAAGVIVRIAWVGALLAIVTILTTAYVLPFETSGTLLVAAWSALTVGAMAAWRFAVSHRLPRQGGRRTLDLGLPVRARFLEDAVLGVRDLVRPAFAVTVPVAILAAAGHLVAFEYPVWTLGNQFISGVPYISVEGLAAAAVISGVLLTGALGARPVLIAAAGFGLMVLIYSLAFEVLPPWVMIPWGVGTVGSIGLVRRVVGIEPQLTGPASAAALAERVPFAAAALGLLCMVVDAVLYAPLDDFVDLLFGTSAVAGIPFVDELTVALVVLAATLLAAGAVWGGVSARAAGIVAAGLAVAWLLPFELRPSLAVAGWAAIAAGGFALIRRVPAVRILVGIPSVGLLAVGVVVALVVVAPPSRLVVDAATVVTGLAILTDATIALVSLALACALGVYLHRAERASLWGAVAAATLLLYAASVAVVDVFQQQVGTRSLEDLQREAQVALSLLWSALGGIAFVAGPVTRLGPVRRAGLVLLGLATAKVFLVDLASLDVAYRVLSLVGLGILMLLSSVAYARHQQREAATVDS
jgi:predicted membrane protein DUF2339